MSAPNGRWWRVRCDFCPPAGLCNDSVEALTGLCFYHHCRWSQNRSSDDNLHPLQRLPAFHLKQESWNVSVLIRNTIVSSLWKEKPWDVKLKDQLDKSEWEPKRVLQMIQLENVFKFHKKLLYIEFNSMILLNHKVLLMPKSPVLAKKAKHWFINLHWLPLNYYWRKKWRAHWIKHDILEQKTGIGFILFTSSLFYSVFCQWTLY